MSVELDKIIPLGRSLQEYERMFSLTGADLQRKILGCGDGPASFNAEMAQRGRPVISCDPLYVVSADEIRSRFACGFETVLSHVRTNPQNFIWSYHRNPEELRQSREAVMRTFLADYPVGLADGRYVVGELPTLPFVDGRFDLALCSHLLFLYSNLLTFEFHLSSILDLCRVASEVRIFPLVAHNCERSPYVTSIHEQLQQLGLRVEIQKVDYQLLRNGDEMLRIQK